MTEPLLLVLSQLVLFFVGVTDGEKAEHKFGHRLRTKVEKR